MPYFYVLLFPILGVSVIIIMVNNNTKNDFQREEKSPRVDDTRLRQVEQRVAGLEGSWVE